jgi:hypothetical protein
VPPSTCSSAPVSPGGLNRAYGHAPRFPLGPRHRHCHSNLSDSVPRIFPNTIFGGSIGPRLTVHTIESWPCMTPRGPLTSSTVLVPAVGRRERGHRHLRAAVEQPASRKFRVDARVHPAKPSLRPVCQSPRPVDGAVESRPSRSALQYLWHAAR